MESLFAELAANKVLGTLPRAELAEYIGGGGYMGATLEKAGLIPEPSMAQVGVGKPSVEQACRGMGDGQLW